LTLKVKSNGKGLI